jgi:type I restriction enzyme, S subunit
MTDNLPKGWEMHRLEDIKTNSDIGLVRNIKEQGVEKPYTYIKMNNITLTGNLDLKKLAKVDATEDELLKYSLKEGDFLFNTRNSQELVGKTCLFNNKEEKVLYNNNIMRLRFNNFVDSEFINYVFLSSFIQNQLESFKSKTTNVCAIYYKKLKSLKIPLPPLPEQKRIVAKLDKLFVRIDKSIALLEENIQHTQNLMASVLEEVFGNNDWPEYKLSDVVTLFNGRAYKRKELLSEGKYKVIRIQNLNGGDNFYYSDLELDKNKYCDKGDLLYSWSGTPGTSFGSFIWNGEKAIFHYHIWKVEIKDSHFRDYLLFALEYLTYKAIEQSHGVTGMMHVTKGKMENFDISIPNLETQKSVASTILKLKNKNTLILSEQQSKLNNLKALKASMLDTAFKGAL